MIAILGTLFFIVGFVLICLSRMAKSPGEKEFREYENNLLKRYVEKMNK